MEHSWRWTLLQPSPRQSGDLSDLDCRLLRDIGVIRTDTGDLVLAEDPTRLIVAPSPPSRIWRPASQLGRNILTVLGRWSLGFKDQARRETSACNG